VHYRFCKKMKIMTCFDIFRDLAKNWKAYQLPRTQFVVLPPIYVSSHFFLFSHFFKLQKCCWDNPMAMPSIGGLWE
jgi:hypothetical protein